MLEQKVNITWKEKRNKICSLINQISCHYGDSDIEKIQEYCKEIIQTNKTDLDKPLRCFEDLARQLEYMPRKE